MTGKFEQLIENILAEGGYREGHPRYSSIHDYRRARGADYDDLPVSKPSKETWLRDKTTGEVLQNEQIGSIDPILKRTDKYPWANIEAARQWFSENFQKLPRQGQGYAFTHNTNPKPPAA